MDRIGGEGVHIRREDACSESIHCLGFRTNRTIAQLGYPSHQALKDWYKEYAEKGDLHREFIRKTRYTQQQKEEAIIDCFDGIAVAWSIGTSPNAEPVNSMLDEAASLLSDKERPIVHSDRGGHYRWPGWLERMERYRLNRSMSRKGCSPDNSACEGFFGHLKNEMFYDRSWEGVSVPQFIRLLDNYENRIKMSLNGLSLIEYRRSLHYI